MKGKNKDYVKGIANEEGNEALRLLTPEMKELVKENCYKFLIFFVCGAVYLISRHSYYY